MTAPADLDARLRNAVFAWLADRTQYEPTLTWRQLQSFTFEGRRLALVTQRGINHPRPLDAALSFMTTYTPAGRRAPYEDIEGPDGLPRYKYRGTDPAQADNRAMRAALSRELPMVWFVGVAQGVYLARWPVWLVAEDHDRHEFSVAVDEAERIAVGNDRMPEGPRQAYLKRLTNLRLHQPVFRAQVMRAYEIRCAICRLRHAELLDAAHIRTDALGGKPIVPNGISLCKIHHAAFDRQIIGVRPDYTVETREDVLAEIDGPMLRHGLQEINGWHLELPKRRVEQPDRDALLERYQHFRGVR